MSDDDLGFEQAIDAVADAVVALLREQPRTAEEVRDALVASGRLSSVGPDIEPLLVDALGLIIEDDERIWHCSDGRLAISEDLLDGAVFTHRITDDEAEHGFLHVGGDLDALMWTDIGGRPLAGTDGKVEVSLRNGLDLRGELTGTPDDIAVYVGPEGWLDGLETGDLVALRRSGDGLELSRPSNDDLSGDAATDDMLRAVIGRRIQPGTGDAVAALICDLLAEKPDAFAQPTNPFTIQLERIGLVERDGFWGRADEEWVDPVDNADLQRRAQRESYWMFGACCHDAFDLVEEAWFDFMVGYRRDEFLADPAEAEDIEADEIDGGDEADGGDPDNSAIVEALAHGVVAPAFADEVFADGEVPEEFGEFIEMLQREGLGVTAAPVYLLSALFSERLGDDHTMERELETSVGCDPTYAAAAIELANFALIRSDVDRAIELIDRTGSNAQRVQYLSMLRDSLAAPFKDAGRNDPCPCGSEKKYKQCCIKDPQVPIAMRIELLVLKLRTYLLRPHREGWFSMNADLAIDGAQLDPDNEIDAQVIAELRSDPVLVDVVLTEGGVVSDFLDDRGELISQDEVELARTLIDEPRRYWEVTEIVPGRSVALGEIDGEASVTIADRIAAENLVVGDHVLTRIIEFEGSPLIVGSPLTVPEIARESARELMATTPGASDFASWYGRLYRMLVDHDEAEFPEQATAGGLILP